MASGSRRDKGDIQQFLWDSFTVFQPVGKHTESQGLNRSQGFFTGLAVGHHSGKGWNLTDPTSILFTFQFDLKLSLTRHSYLLLVVTFLELMIAYPNQSVHTSLR